MQETIARGDPVGLAVDGHDEAKKGAYRLSWVFAPDVVRAIATVICAGERAFRKVLLSPGRCCEGCVFR